LRVSKQLLEITVEFSDFLNVQGPLLS